MDRVLEIWELWHGTATEKKWDSIYFGNLHCNLRAVKNLKKLAGVASWFNLDGQGRGGDVHPLWYCSQQGRVAQSVMRGRMITNVVGSYATTNYTIWRHSSKPAEEAILWMAQTAAAGMVPWYHRLGAAPEEDRRWRQVGLDFYQWMARHDRHFRNNRSLADVAILYSQRTLSFWGVNEGNAAQDRGARLDYFEGLYYALLQGRHLFDFVHEDNLDKDTLKDYRALILPNVAFLSDHQCEQLRAYVNSGGCLLATYETSLYNEWGDRRSNFGLGDLLGVEVAGLTQGPLRNSYARIASFENEILASFAGTSVLPGALFRVPVRLKGSGEAPMRYVAPYPSHPPEMVYPREPENEEPAFVLTDHGAGRVAYFPGDVDRSCWRTSNTDLDLLLQKTIRWVKGDAKSPVRVSGEGVLEMFAWETEAGFALHLINCTNPHIFRGWVRDFYPVGRQEVTIRIPDELRIVEVKLLRAERKIPLTHEDQLIRFEVPRIVDYEVIVLSRS
ncbi:MAG: beta-galactosidase trimerization domain-containing protein, partial [bacterium]